MKAKLAEVVQDAPSAESVEPEELRKYFAKFDEEFFTFCDKGNSNSIYACVRDRKIALKAFYNIVSSTLEKWSLRSNFTRNHVIDSVFAV